MKQKIETTINEICLTVIQFNDAINNNNPDGLLKFKNDFIPLLNRFTHLMLYPENKTQEYLLWFKDEISDVFNELFIESQIYKVAEKLIEQIEEKEKNCFIGYFCAIKSNGNPLNILNDSLKSKPGYSDSFKAFVAKYQGLYKSPDNEFNTIINIEYINLIYKYYKEYFPDESLQSWKERFILKGRPVTPIAIDAKATEGSNKLILIAILAAIQETTGSAFDFEDFVLNRFGIQDFEKAKSIHKEKQTFKATLSKCRAIIKKMT